MATTALHLSFKRSDHKIMTLILSEPTLGLKGEAINTAMDTLITKDIFRPGGSSLLSKVSAKTVITDESIFEII